MSSSDDDFLYDDDSDGHNLAEDEEEDDGAGSEDQDDEEEEEDDDDDGIGMDIGEPGRPMCSIFLFLVKCTVPVPTNPFALISHSGSLIHVYVHDFCRSSCRSL